MLPSLSYESRDSKKVMDNCSIKNRSRRREKKMINLQTVAIFSTDRSIRNFASHGKIIVFTVGEQFAGQRRHERHGSNRPSTTAISTTFYEVNSVVIRRALFPRLKGKAFAHRRIACVDASGHIVECKPRSRGP